MEQRLQNSAFGFKASSAKDPNHKPKRNQFLISLYNALEKKEYEAAMCWDTDGKAFILRNPEAIADRILTHEFSGMKFSSFVRQLSYYGFKRVSRRSNVKVYSHEQFRRDRKDFLKQIKRNHKGIEESKVVVKETVAPKKDQEMTVLDSMQKKIEYLQAELEKMKTENLALRSCIKNLSLPEENSMPVVEEDLQSCPTNVENKSSSTGFYQTYFHPQVQGLSANMNQNGYTLMCQQNQPAFIEVFQPDCRTHQPYFGEKQSMDTANSHEIYLSSSNDGEENNFFKSNNPGNSDENYWRFEEFGEDCY